MHFCFFRYPRTCIFVKTYFAKCIKGRVTVSCRPLAVVAVWQHQKYHRQHELQIKSPPLIVYGQSTDNKLIEFITKPITWVHLSAHLVVFEEGRAYSCHRNYVDTYHLTISQFICIFLLQKKLQGSTSLLVRWASTSKVP